ncbi:MAG TPA: C1 family peptidase [Pirellulales bacterium]|nr:C1 family peptidase [Pirellulales bacterium]
MRHATRRRRVRRFLREGLGWIAVVAMASVGGAAEADALPKAVNLIPDFQKQGLIPLAQGNRDDCSLFAITGVTEFECARHAAAPHGRLSEEFLIWASDKATGKKGDQAMFYEAVQGLNVHGICAAELMPYKEKRHRHQPPSPQAVADARKLRERWRIEWIKRWSVDRLLSEHELLEIKRALASGHPVACGLRWPNELQGDQLLAVPPANQVFDGHSIVFVGYEDDRGQPGGGLLRFRNSSGADWGDQGYGSMSYAYARTYANDAIGLRLGPEGSEFPTVRYEAETMTVLAAAKCEAAPQKMNDFGGLMWSHGEQLFCHARKGGFVELDFVVKKPGRYRVRVLATAAPDFGIVRAALDNRRLPREFDLYCGRVSPAGSLELGTHELAPGRHRLRMTAVSKDAVAKGFSFGLDAVDLIAAN